MEGEKVKLVFLLHIVADKILCKQHAVSSCLACVFTSFVVWKKTGTLLEAFGVRKGSYRKTQTTGHTSCRLLGVVRRYILWFGLFIFGFGRWEGEAEGETVRDAQQEWPKEARRGIEGKKQTKKGILREKERERERMRMRKKTHERQRETEIEKEREREKKNKD